MKRGFTLFELILVMLIVTISMAIVAPSLSGFLGGRKTADTVNQIVALARHARSQALADGKIYRLNVDTQTGEYWIDARDGASFADIASEHGRRYKLPDGMTAKWRTDDNAPVFPKNTANQQQSSAGLGGSSTGGAGSLTGSSGGLGGSKSGQGGGLGGMNSAKGKQGDPIETSVSFYPDGRNDSLILTLDLGDGDKVELGAYSETELWGVMKEDDK